MEDRELERLANGRVIAPTGILRGIVLGLLGIFIALVLVGMLLLIVS